MIRNLLTIVTGVAVGAALWPLSLLLAFLTLAAYQHAKRRAARKAAIDMLRRHHLERCLERQ